MNVYLITFIIALLLSGCATTAQIADSDRIGDESQGEETAELADQEEAEEVLVVVNGEEITINEYNEKLKQLSVYEKARYRGEEGHKKFLQALIRRKVMVQEARKKELDKDVEVQKKIEVLVQEMTERVLMETLAKKEVWERVVVTDKEAKTYYDEHNEEFMEKEKARVRQILLATEEEAQKIRQELEEGADFAKLAEEKSIDQATAKQGGDSGYLERGKMPSEFEEACFSLEIGGIGGPVKTKFGYHIIKLEDKKEASIKEFYEVSEEIKKKLISGKQQKEYQEWLRQLEEKAKIEIKTSFGKDPVESS